MNVAAETVAYQAMLEAQRGCPMDHEARMAIDEDVQRARAALERAWLAHTLAL